jgi:hypothetical protein
LALVLAAPFVTALLSSWSRFRDESELAILIVVGSGVYGGLVIALLGRRWLSLMRGGAQGAPPAILDRLESVSPPGPGPDRI